MNFYVICLLCRVVSLTSFYIYTYIAIAYCQLKKSKETIFFRKEDMLKTNRNNFLQNAPVKKYTLLTTNI